MTQQHCFFHPLSNDISPHARDLDKFLKSIGREPSYVDLEANINLLIWLHLFHLIPLFLLILQKRQFLCKVTHIILLLQQAPSTVKDKRAVAAHQPSLFSDPGLLVEEILNKTSSILLSEITEKSIPQHGDQLGTVVADTMRKRLTLTSLAIMFKNTAYAQGFNAGTRCHPKPL